MSEKFIEIKDGIYVVTDGNFKIMKGNFTEEELKEIYQLAQEIENIKEQKKYYEKEKANVQFMKNNAKKAWTVRVIPTLTCIISLITTGISQNLFATFFLISGCTVFQIFVEKGLKMICGTKKEREEIEKNAISMLKSLNHDLETYEKTLEKSKEKTNYREIPYEGNEIVKPVFDDLDNETEEMENFDELQNNASFLNQTYENERRYGIETVIANSGRWAGYEDIPSNYPSKIIVEGSFRTERDDTMEMGVLYRHLEEDDDEISQEQSGPVKKLTPPKR